jgi:hypothetical protein
MSDFDNAIEDALLRGALHDDTPQPVKHWATASKEEIDVYTQNITQKDPLFFELHTICSNCLGFYLVLFKLLLINSDM